MRTRAGDVRLPLLRVVLGERFGNEGCLSLGQLHHELSQLANHELGRVADIHRTCHRIRCVHEADQAVDQVIHIAE